MFKNLCISSALTLLTLSTACTFGDGTPAGCETAFTGTYSGTFTDPDTEEVSEVSGQMYAAWTDDEITMERVLRISLIVPDDTPDDATDNPLTRPKNVTVESDGTITSEDAGVLRFYDSVMDLDTCEVSGTWYEQFTGTGPFTLGTVYSF